MKAELITCYRNASAHGGIVEMMVWRVPEPVPPSEHPYKYRLVYVVGGVRVVGFDNERGKGDHKHVGDVQSSYLFAGVDRLIDDFLEEIERWKQGH